MMQIRPPVDVLSVADELACLVQRRGAAPYLAGDRTTYSDPRGGPAAPYPPPPPAGGGGSGYGGGHGGGRTRGGGSGGGYYGSHGAPPSARHTAAGGERCALHCTVQHDRS